MQRLTEQILAHAEQLPEGTPLMAKDLVRLGSRAAVNQALSRLAKREQLFRAERGVYLCPIKSRFGIRLPMVEYTIDALAAQRGETIVPNGASAANLLGLTRQMPVRYLYLTSGRSRTLMFGKQRVKLRHAPDWQLSYANRPAGKAIRALDWLGPEHAEKGLRKLKETLPTKEFEDLVAAAPRLPTWLARIITGEAAHT